MPPSGTFHPRLDRLAPRLAYLYMSFVGLTSRVRWLGLEHVRALRGRGFIYALWHDRQALFTYTHRGHGVSILVSRSSDGEIIARIMELSGLSAVRGSSSRAALPATRELLSLAAMGRTIGITPDGPRGPARRVKPGALYLALKSGLPIVPISNAVSRKLVMRRSWDRFQLPLPFGRACVIHGGPITVSGGDDLQAKARELEEALNRITAEAEREVG